MENAVSIINNSITHVDDFINDHDEREELKLFLASFFNIFIFLINNYYLSFERAKQITPLLFSFINYKKILLYLYTKDLYVKYRFTLTKQQIDLSKTKTNQIEFSILIENLSAIQIKRIQLLKLGTNTSEIDLSSIVHLTNIKELDLSNNPNINQKFLINAILRSILRYRHTINKEENIMIWKNILLPKILKNKIFKLYTKVNNNYKKEKTFDISRSNELIDKIIIKVKQKIDQINFMITQKHERHNVPKVWKNHAFVATTRKLLY